MEWPVIMDRFIIWINHYGYFAIFCSLMLGIGGVPIPDELILTFVGYLVYKGTLHPMPAIITVLLGSTCGISLSYSLGRFVGLHLILRYGQVFHINMDLIDQIRLWFERIGKWTLVVGYFIPGVRHFTGFVAGTSNLGILTFACYAYSGAIFWSMTFLSFGYFLGKNWFKMHSYFYLFPLVTIILVIGIPLARFVIQLYRRTWSYRNGADPMFRGKDIKK